MYLYVQGQSKYSVQIGKSKKSRKFEKKTVCAKWSPKQAKCKEVFAPKMTILIDQKWFAKLSKLACMAFFYTLKLDNESLV